MNTNQTKRIGETNSDYPHVLIWDFGHEKATRIVECRNRIQWIIQHRRTDGWICRSFCRTRAALENLLPGKAKEIRAALPEMIN